MTTRKEILDYPVTTLKEILDLYAYCFDDFTRRASIVVQ